MTDPTPLLLDPALSLAPTSVLEVTGPRSVRPGRTASFLGSAMFLDISGFTTMSERLGRLGSEGTEELVGILNRFFAPAIGLIRGSGGDVVAFGGDAITAVWPGHIDGADVMGCAGSLLELVRSMSSLETAAGELELHARIGISGGAMRHDVGGIATRHVIVTHGAAIDAAVDREHIAELDSIAADLPGTPRLDDPPDTLTLEITPTCLAHPVIIERMRRGDDALIEGHRRVTTLFARIADGQLEPGLLDGMLTEVVRAVTDLGGEIIQVTGGDKGTLAMATFGAPTSSPDDAPRAIAAAERMVTAIDGASIGISTGTVFAGQIGDRARRVYTVIGDSVNLAARLMQRAGPGEVLTDGPTRSPSTAQFTFGAEETVSVKGRDEPVVTAPLTGRRGRAWSVNRLASDGPLIGRATEHARCGSALREAGDGRLRRIVIRGRPGLGKSRLGRAVAELARSLGWSVLPSGFAGFGDATPYAGWQPVLRHILNRHAELSRGVEALLPGSGSLAPLLGPLLGVETIDNPTTSSMTGETRNELAEELASRLIERTASGQPMLIVLEDWHWADESSGRLLETITARAGERPIVVLITERIDEHGPVISARATDLVLELADLDVADALRLAASAWARSHGGVADAEVIERITRSGGGNPLMLETLTQVGSADVAIESLSGLLQSRLDALADDELRPLLWASAFARPFTPAELETSLGRSGHRGDLNAPLDRLIAGGLLTTAPLADEIAFSFRHASIQEAAYERLSHDSRRGIHHSIAVTLEERGAPAVEVARHLVETSDGPRQERWFFAAGLEARAAWALDDARGWFTKVADLDQSSDSAAGAMVELAEILTFQGDLAAASAALGRAGSTHEDPRRLRCVGEIALLAGRVDEAVEALRRALHHATTGGLAGEIAASGELLSRAMCESGWFDSALEVARSALGEIERVDAVDQARLLGAIATVLTARLDLADAAPMFEAAIDRLGDADPIRLIHLLSDLSATRALLGEMQSSVEALLSARDLAVRIGYRRHLAISQGNEAEIRLLVGDYAAVGPGAMTSLDMSAQHGDVGMAADDLLRLASDRDLPAADRHRIFADGMALEQRLDRPHALAEWLVARAEFADERHDERHGELAAEALELARRLERPDLELRLALGNQAQFEPTELADLRQRVDTEGERFLADVASWRLSGLPHPTELVDRGRALFRHTPFVAYRQALARLGDPEPPTDVVLRPREPSDGDVSWSPERVDEIVREFHRRLDGR